MFVFGDGDTVTDFGRGNDLIDIRNFDAINAGNLETSVTIEDGGGGVEVRIGDAVLTLNGVTAADISTDDFLLA